MIAHFITRCRSALALCLSVVMVSCQPAEPGGLVGTLERDRIELKVETSEPITAIHVADGQQVKRGEPVLQQDTARAQARLEQQMALRDQAAARLAELERGPRQEAIRQSRARLESVQAISSNAHAEYQRVLDVYQRQLASKASVDALEAAWKSARSEEQAAREALAELLNGTTPEELQQAAAALASAQAQVSQARIDVERLAILAPMDGRIDKVLFELGERPSAGATVAILLDQSRSYARVYVPEPLKARMQPGAAVRVVLDGMEDSHSGTVRWVSSDASFTPYFALTEHDRSRLTYLAEIDLEAASSVPSGTPLVVYMDTD